MTATGTVSSGPPSSSRSTFLLDSLPATLAVPVPLGLGQESFQLGDAGVAVGKAVVQLPQLGSVALEQFAQMGDLSDQLLVGAGFSARRSDARQNSQR